MIWQSGYRMGFYRGGPVIMSALAGVDIALWDLKGLSIDSRPRNVHADFFVKLASSMCPSTSY